MAERVGELPPSHWLVDDVVAVDDDGNEIIVSGDDPVIIHSHDIINQPMTRW